MGLGFGAGLQGWRGSYEVWVMPSNWLLELGHEAGWVRACRLDRGWVGGRGAVWVGGGCSLWLVGRVQ